MHITRPTWSRVGGILVSVMLATSPVSPTLAFAATAVNKSETVHVQTDASGSVSEITVEELLANDGKKELLEDRSNLTGIEPSDDSQSFSKGSDDTITWTTGGKQVSYEGISDETLPVNIKVSYTLDGVSVDPESLAGASGRLIIRIDYENTSTQTITTGGIARTVNTPFVCLTAALLDGDIFSNVSVENGRVIDDKGGLAVIGIAAPGLTDSLAIDPDTFDLDLPEYLQITADVTDLTLDPIYTIVTPELLTDLDTDALDLDLGDLDEGTDKLSEAMRMLIDGSGTLGSALRQLTSGSEQLGAGVAEFKEKISALPTGMTALSNGIGQLSDGLTVASGAAGQLAEGAQGVAGQAQGALDGLGQVQQFLGSAGTKVSALNSALAELGDTTSAISSANDAATKAHDAAEDAHKGLSEMDASLEEQKAPVSSDIDQASETLDALSPIQIEGLTEEQQQQLDAANERIAAAKEQAAQQLDVAKANLDSVDVTLPDTLATDVETLAQAAKTLEESKDKIASSSKALDGAKEAGEAIEAAGTALAGSGQALQGVAYGASGVSGGASKLAESLDQAAAGAQQLKASLSQFGDAAPQMLQGMDALAQGIGQLSSGLKATADGSDQLTSGLSTFNNEGISELVDALKDMDADMSDVSNRLDALRLAAEGYDTFAGKLDEQTSSVRFLFKTEQIG